MNISLMRTSKVSVTRLRTDSVLVSIPESASAATTNLDDYSALVDVSLERAGYDPASGDLHVFFRYPDHLHHLIPLAPPSNESGINKEAMMVIGGGTTIGAAMCTDSQEKDVDTEFVTEVCSRLHSEHSRRAIVKGAIGVGAGLLGAIGILGRTSAAPYGCDCGGGIPYAANQCHSCGLQCALRCRYFYKPWYKFPGIPGGPCVYCITERTTGCCY